MAGPLWVLDLLSGVYKRDTGGGGVDRQPHRPVGPGPARMRFDDPAGPSVTGRAYLAERRHGTSGPDLGACELLAGGRIGGGLQLAGQPGDVQVPLNVSETAYAASLWFSTTCTNCGIFSVYKGAADHDLHA